MIGSLGPLTGGEVSPLVDLLTESPLVWGRLIVAVVFVCWFVIVEVSIGMTLMGVDQ